MKTAWLIRKFFNQIPQVDPKWEEDDYVHHMNNNFIARICLNDEDNVLAILTYKVKKGSYFVKRFVYKPGYEQYAKRLLNELSIKLSQYGKNYAFIYVDEYDVQTQLFFKSCGIKAVDIKKSNYVFRMDYNQVKLV